MKQPAYKILLLTIALVLVTALVVTAQTVDRTTLNNKVACGYQGWFACPGDGSQATVGWHHWSDDRTDIGPGLYRTDVWPDIAEYSASDLYTVPNTTLVYGGTPKLFSSRKPGVTNTHFRWMQENQIDGVFVQRYTVVTIGNPNDPFQEFKDTVLQNVMDATVTYGRAFAITYDISATPEAELYDRITNDWNYLKNTFNIKNHSRYWYHNGQPVIMIWGLGFSDRPGTPAMAQNIINFFKNDGCFVLGGVPWGWRTLGPPSKTDPAWNAVYRSYDGISPWSIGLYSDWASINSYKTNYAQPDINECNSLGIYYMPTSWPRFGWDNMNEYPCGQSKIGTRGGQQLWDQFYAFKSIGAHGQYVAMFDEYDESTAIMKLTDNVPTSGCWFNTEGKGSDWQLRLTNQGSKMQRGEIALSQTIPINSAVSPDNAVVVSDTIPATMTTGQHYNVSVTMQNTGETCWNAEFFQLGTVDDSDPFYASTRVFMPAGTTVMPNGQYTFNFTLTAPTTPGTYTTDWQMVHMLVRWFGAQVVKQVQVSGPAGVGTLNSKAGGTITVDGNSSDWTLSAFTTKTRGGMNETGDYAILGFDGGTCYYGARCTDFVLPANAADHTAKVYSRDKATYLYFLVRCDDNDIRYNNPTSANWANDCVEFYIDPSHNHGANPISNSTSDFQLVIDANNQKNVYMCTSGYKTQVLGGVTSAVVRDGTGWWLEVRITKTAIDPDLPGVGTIGFDISCRDNDNNNDPADTSVYTWQDPELSAGCPTKIPNRWGELDLSSVPDTTPPGNVSSFTGTSGPGKVTLNWTNPSDSDYTAVMIRFKTTGYPTSITDGTFVVDDPGAPGAADSFVHGGTPGVTYYYKAFAHDGALNYASGVTASGTPTTDTTAPCPVTNFAAVAGNQQVSFSWINPSDADFTGTMIRFKTTGYPTSVTDGEEIYNGAGWSMSHIDLTNGTTYYYSAFAYGGVPNYATKTDVSAATPAGLTWDVQYEGSVLPSVASPAWIVGPGYENWAYIDTGTVRVDDDSPDSGSQIVWR